MLTKNDVQYIQNTGNIALMLPILNADGSYDVFFGPEAPTGFEKNWLQTVPGKSWFIFLRMYGPLQPWIDKAWRPGEVTLVRQDS